jgi:hypothetical protein
MPGLTLPIGTTNPKTGAVQFDGRRTDGVEFHIPSGASVTSAPVGSVVTLQEDANGKQFIVLGAAAYSGSDEYGTCQIISVGFLEAATQVDSRINQTVGEYVDGDIAAMISDINAVAAVPTVSGSVPTAGGTSYITVNGKLSSSSGSAVAFPGTVWFGTAGQQNKGQLKTGYCYARLSSVKIGA